MERSRIRGGALGTALCGLLTFGGCTDDGPADAVAESFVRDEPATGVPARSAGDDAFTGSNFDFAIGDAYRDGPSASGPTVERLEAFFGGALSPLQDLSGLLDRPVSVRYERCGEINAFHDRGTDTITLCHELFEYGRGLFADDGQSNDLEAAFGRATSHALSAMAFTLYHEIAHALHFQRGLPIVGNIESAMDAIATVIAVETGRSEYAISGAAVFGEEAPSLAGVHGSGEDRGGDIACWSVGGDRSAASVLLDPQITDVFSAAGRDCPDEYAQLRTAVRTWVPRLARLGDGASGPIDREAVFRYVPGPTWLEGEGIDPSLQRGMARRFADLLAPLNDTVTGIAAPIAVLYETCGESRSSYDAATRTITLCTELVESVYRYFLRDFGEPEDAIDAAYTLEQAYGFLGFALYHEVGHVLHSLGRMDGSEDVESISDAVAAVLLVESGDWMVVLNAALFTFFDQPPEQTAFHGEPGDRPDELLCLMMGGDAGLRADPRFASQVERYVTGERDCVGRYAERREAVRGWLAPPGS